MLRKKVAILLFVLVLSMLFGFVVDGKSHDTNIVSVYKEVDLQEKSAVIVLENAPTSHYAIYLYWLNNKAKLAKKYGVAFSKQITTINFMSPSYEASKHLKNQYCFSKVISNQSKQCIDEDNSVLGMSYDEQDERITLFLHDPFCMTYLDKEGVPLLADDSCLYN